MKDVDLNEFRKGFMDFLLFRCTSQLKNYFIRWGMDVLQESDDRNIARRLYDYGRWAWNHSGDPYCLGSDLHQIDFDLIGSDGQLVPLRMLMWEGDMMRDISFCAEVKDRETGVLVAEATNKLVGGGSSRKRAIVCVKSEQCMEQRYKPHGNIPMQLKQLSLWGDEEDDLYVTDDDLYDPGLFSELTPEQFDSFEELPGFANRILQSFRV
ncbi:hypothetical protein CBR_g38680 [Chara braunii]|uniref:Uncharacterized protein n=1 Tax=Chara braunii TaxID=69332 RepID=A0A388LPZ0_CHABU|nr:hypothetical protein CBR_g38680 [Chara braunii]|eukprot:GBG84398.1 hypothetical protein CBR_g38680 [Chara braunii]